VLFLYHIFLSLYSLGIRIYSLFNSKAKKWIEGRRGWDRKLSETLMPGEKRIWMHCASLGEFEQGRPLIEALKEQYAQYKIVLTFFSPSGYEACKNYANADYVFYLPMDGRHNAQKFIAHINPSLAIFVKYEFWYHYLHQLSVQKIPSILASAAFRKDQAFFKWYGGFFREMLQCFSFVFMQDNESQKLLQGIGINRNVLLSGDTRYDRVSAIAKNIKPIELIAAFKSSNKILIAGSTWPDDENILQECIASLPANWKVIIAPHEIDEGHIRKVQQLFSGTAVLFSELQANGTGDKKVLVIDNIGMLSGLYAYGDIAYVGGGFQKGGIHNILEPAIFGLPVIFGPVYGKFVEAKELTALHYAFPVNNAAGCTSVLEKLISDKKLYDDLRNSLKGFMQQKTGATNIILNQLIKESWLEN
jgi:3-deoxy-D-manno-octulosonic-acid transferase